MSHRTRRRLQIVLAIIALLGLLLSATVFVRSALWIGFDTRIQDIMPRPWYGPHIPVSDPELSDAAYTRRCANAGKWFITGYGIAYICVKLIKRLRP